MKQNQRFVLFLILSMGIFLGWMYIGPRVFPNLFPKPRQNNVAADQDKNKDEKKKLAGKAAANNQKKDETDGHAGPVRALKPGKHRKQPAVKEPPKVAAKKKAAAPPDKPQPRLAVHPRRNIKLGTLDPTSGYFLQVSLVSEGAAVEFIELNDVRYQTLDRQGHQLKAVGNTVADARTLDTAVKAIDDQLKPFGQSLRTVNWQVDGKPDVKNGIITGVTFSLTSPDGKLKVSKRYWLEKVDLTNRNLLEAQDTNSKGYELHFSFKIENLSAAPQADLFYRLKGPVGVPLEDAANARVHRGIVAGFVQDDGTVKSSSLTAKEVVKAVDADETKEWKTPIRYIGVDVHYFVAMIVPDGDQVESPYIEVARPEVVDRAANIKHSDITVELTSKKFTLAAKGKRGSSVEHTYKLFAGPKRKELLAPYDAGDIIKYGWFGWISQGMLWLMNLLHAIGLPYGLAIIGLTILVRSALFPLSRKQAKSAAKMKELQPKMAELKKKYANDKEKLARAQMELFAKHGANPLAGCLPVILQMPIFFGLYRALGNAVDLRLAPFPLTWIDNLAAQDALFKLPFAVPLVGWTTFNLLPIITIGLFIVQQQMFMPPPTDDQSAMQQKMMKYMSIFMGFLFYTVPSGLCIYFIASSMWGIGERKLLDLKKKEEASGRADAPGSEKGGPGGPGPEPGSDKPKGFFGKLMAMADEAAQAKARANGNPPGGKSGNNGKNSGRKGRKPRGSRR
jgi:YidC/Oxa1 family membrane protein insertase